MWVPYKPPLRTLSLKFEILPKDFTPRILIPGSPGNVHHGSCFMTGVKLLSNLLLAGTVLVPLPESRPNGHGDSETDRRNEAEIR